MALLSNINIDDEGRWFTYYEDPEGEDPPFEIMLSSTSSPSYKRLQRKLGLRYADMDKSKFSAKSHISEKNLQLMTIELGVDLVRGWRGFQMVRSDFYMLMGTKEDGLGDPKEIITVDYAKPTAQAILSKPGFNHLLDFVVETANDLSNFTKRHIEAAVRNSQTASDSN